MKNIPIMQIMAGNLPLQGMKTLVKIAKIRIFLDSIILAPVTPTALHPSPMHIVRLCLPQDPHFENGLSKLNAILGNKP